MRYLYSFIFCPISRKIAFALIEKKIKFQEVVEDMTSPSHKFLSLHAMADIPTFVDHHIICANAYAACEYIEEVYQKPGLMGHDPESRVSIRQLIQLFDQKFYQEVYLTLFYEKTLKRILMKKSPDTTVMKQGKYAMQGYLMYLDNLADIHKFIACETFSWADITVASHISCIDYLGEIAWRQYPSLKEWYMKIKSRPAFREILAQTFPGVDPAPHYINLDF